MTKVATVSGYVVAVVLAIGGLMMGRGLFPAAIGALWMFFLVKGVLLVPGYFMEGLRGTSGPPVKQSVLGEDSNLPLLDRKNSRESSGIGLMPKCPRCGITYDPNDYRSDATAIYCSACKAELPRA
jgi:hypothetical protein